MSDVNIEAENFLRAAIENRRLTKDFTKSSEFKQYINTLEQRLDDDYAGERARALAIFGHLAETSAPARKFVVPILSKSSRRPIGPVGLEIAKDREYFAKALQYVSCKWRVESAALLLSQSDPAASKVAEPLFEILHSDFGSSAEFVDFVISNFLKLRNEGSHKVAFLNRKAEQIFVGLLDLVSQSDKPIGDQSLFGSALSELVIIGFNKQGPENFKKADEVAVTLLSSLRKLIRFRFREVVTIGDLYRIAKRIIGWWEPGSPPLKVERSVMQVVDEGFGALHLFTLQGVNDKALRSALSDAFGPDRLRLAFNRNAKDDQRVTRDDARWLADGVEPRSSAPIGSAQALSEEAVDDLIAVAFIAQLGGSRAAADLGAISEELEGLNPTLAKRVSDARRNIEKLSIAVRSIARSRSMKLEPAPGTRVVFDPAIHESGIPIDRGTTVIVAVPGVVREYGMHEKLIIKPLVELV